MSRHSNLVLLTGSKFPTWLLNAGGQRPKLDIDFVNNRAWNSASASISSLLSCTRATPAAAYYTKADGTLTTFAANTLRFGTNGLLVEEARANLATRSQTLDSVDYTQTGLASVTADQIAAPDGTITADLLTEDTGNSRHIVSKGVTLSNATVYTFSCYAKQGTRSRIILKMDGSPSNFAAIFNLANGTVGNTANSTATITAIANGWYWCTMTFTAQFGGGVAHSGLANSDTFDGSNESTYVGNGSTVYIWGIQMELGAFATSYIPTTTASVTRAADVVTFSNISWVPGATPWSACVYGQSQCSSFETYFSLLNGGSTRYRALRTSTGALRLLGDGTGDLDISTGNNFTSQTPAKAACGVDTNNASVVLNGGTVATDATCTLSALGTAAAALGGLDSAGNPLNGSITRFAFWNSRLSNGALQTLTT